MALLSKLLFKRKVLAFMSLCAGVLTAAVTLWWNTQLRDIINTVNEGTAPALPTILWALITLLASGAITGAKGYMTGYTGESMTHDLRMGYAQYFLSLPVAEIEKLNAGEAVSKLQNEMAGVSGYLNANLFQLVDDGIRFFSTFIWLLCISPTLTLSANLPVFFILVYVLWSSRVIGTATTLSQQAKGYMNGCADTLLTLFPIIRLYDAARLLLNSYRVAINTWEQQTFRAERLRARLMSLSALLSNIPLLLLFLIGGLMTIHGMHGTHGTHNTHGMYDTHSTLSVGTLYVFLNLSGNVSGVLMNMPGYVGAFRQFLANIKRLEGKVCL